MYKCIRCGVAIDKKNDFCQKCAKIISTDKLTIIG